MPLLRETKPISKFLIEKFLTGEFDKVSVLYTRFINTLTLQNADHSARFSRSANADLRKSAKG